MKDKHMVTVAEAAEILGCSRQNVDAVIARNKIDTIEAKITQRRVVARKVTLRQVDLNDLKSIIKVKDTGGQEPLPPPKKGGYSDV